MGRRLTMNIAADHLEAPIVFKDVDLVGSELRPLAGQTARGIIHLSSRPAGSRESYAVSFTGLTPGATYEIGLTRGTCKSLGDVHSFFDLGAELAFTADSTGAIAGQRSMDLTRPRPQGQARSIVLRSAEDDTPVACGLLLAFERVDVTQG